MTPTNELRFVKRYEPMGPVGESGGQTCRTVRILQQKWTGVGPSIDHGWIATADLKHKEEWRDVPTVEE